MAQALREREQENEMFIYSVSHDLRSPMVNLQGFSEELSLSCQDLRAALEGAEAAAGPARRVLEKDIPDSVHFIKTAVSRLSAIIDALLRLSRVGRVEYRIQPVDVETAVRRVVESLAGAVKGRKAEVVVGAMPPALGDPTAVEQIFANLIGNAVAYLDPTRPGRVEVGALESGGRDGPCRSADVLCQGQRVRHSEGVSGPGFPGVQAAPCERGPGRGRRAWPSSIAWWGGSVVRSGWSPRPA